MNMLYFDCFEGNPAIDKARIENIASTLKCVFPNDYLIFIEKFNGGSGTIGNNSHLILWRLEELETNNYEYEVDLYAKGFLIFGSNGGGMAYAFKKSDGTIFEFPFIGMAMDEQILIGENFIDFLNYLKSK